MRVNSKFHISTAVPRFLVLTFFIIVNNNGVDGRLTAGENNVLIIGARVTSTTQIKVLVYSRGENSPADMLKFTGIKEQDDINGTAICEKLKYVDHFYECRAKKAQEVGSSEGNRFNAFLNLYAESKPQLGMEELLGKQSVDILKFETKYFPLIQIDKMKYKTGESVKMRIFYIRSDGTAANQSEIRNFHVEIRNELNETLFTFSENNFIPKVYSRSYQLSKDASEGEYTIYLWTNFVANEDDQSRSFEGEKSVSQKFIVHKNLQTSPLLHIETERIVRPYSNIVLKLSSENREKLSGKLDVLAQVIHNGKKATFKKTSQIQLEQTEVMTVPIDTKKDLRLINSISDYDVIITVQFTDFFNQQETRQHLNVTVAKTDRLQLIVYPEEDYFEPGKNFKIHVYLKDIDGKYLESTAGEVYMGVTYKYQLGMCDEIGFDPTFDKYIFAGSKTVDKYTASFEVNVPYNTTSIEFDASYEISNSVNVEKTRKKFVVVRTPDVPVSRHYVNIQPLRNRIRDSEEYIKYKIRSKLHSFGTTEAHQETFYVVFIGEKGEMKIEQKERKQTAELIYKTKLEPWMVPSVNMIIIAHSIFGEFVYDALKIVINSPPRNIITIQTSPDFRKKQNLQSGQQILLNISTNDINEENSSVHLQISEESAKYLDDNNIMTRLKLNDIINQRHEKEQISPVFGRLDDRFNKLSKFNAFIITNTHLQEKNCKLAPKVGSVNQKLEMIENGTRKPEKVSIDGGFPETVLFEDILGSNFLDNTYTQQTYAPNSKKTYVVNGFIFHPVHGLGISTEKKFNVVEESKLSRKFSSQSSYTETVFHSSAFNDSDRNDKQIKDHKKEVPAFNYDEKDQHGESHVFEQNTLENPTNFGTDSTENFILTPDADQIVKKYGFFVDLTNGSDFSHQFSCKFPNNVVNDSKKVSATVYGNSLGPFFTDAERLISLKREKYDKQLSIWMPSIVAYKLLFAVGQLDEDKKNLLDANIMEAYEIIRPLLEDEITPTNLRSLWSDPSSLTLNMNSNISSDSDENYSNWSFTAAYLAKLVISSRKIANIDNEDIIKLLNYIKSKQAKNGSFNDLVQIPYYGTSSVPLTALILSNFLKYEKDSRYQSTVEACVKFLYEKLGTLKKNFERAITAYALSLQTQKSHDQEKKFSKLLGDLKESAMKTELHMYWHMKNNDKTLSPVHIETASYVLMALINNKSQKENINENMKDILMILNWLSSMKNTNGRYFNQHDTDVATEALGEATKILKFQEANIELDISFYDEDEVEFAAFNITNSNINETQYKVFAQTPDDILMNVNGNGIAFTELTCEYSLVNQTYKNS